VYKNSNVSLGEEKRGLKAFLITSGKLNTTVTSRKVEAGLAIPKGSLVGLSSFTQNMYSLPTTIAEIDKFTTDQVQESLHLEYKDSRALDPGRKEEIAKDVSAFANSDGGLLIYGITERESFPAGKDAGVDHIGFSRERLEQLIASNISPRIDGVRIAAIPLSADRSIFAIEVPKSVRGPHQSADRKYYKRFNFQSVPMENFEIEDVRNRRRTVSPLVEVSIYIRRRILVYLNITNIGDQTAEDVTFELPEEVRGWAEEQQARLFLNGIKYFPPKRTYSFRYGHMPQLLNESSKLPSQFAVTVNYTHPAVGHRTGDVFQINLMDYWGASFLDSEISDQGKEIKEALTKLTAQVEKLNSNVERITTIAGTTGIDLSVTSLRNLRHVLSGDTNLEKLNPSGLAYTVFAEVLGVDYEIASRLEQFFWHSNSAEGIEQVEGINNNLIAKLKQHFILSDCCN
jgi:hypothetical protein